MRLSPCLPLLTAFLLAGCASNVPLTSAAPAPAAAKPGAQARPLAAAANPWASVHAHVGRSPSDGDDFLRTGPMAARLQGLLGPVNYPELLLNMAVSTPLRQGGGLIYLTGRRSQQAGAPAAALVLEPARDAMRVWLQTGDEEWDVQDAGAPVPLPADVRAVMDEARR